MRLPATTTPAWTPVLLAIVLQAEVAMAWDRQVKQGETLARTDCARCHAVGRVGAGPLREAPPYRELHTRYRVEELGEALAEGIRTDHLSMPEFPFDPDQAEALIAYLKSLER